MSASATSALPVAEAAACLHDISASGAHCWSHDTVDTFHDSLAPLLAPLLLSTAFRYFRIRLDAPCRVWPNAQDLCNQPGCAVQESQPADLPPSLRTLLAAGEGEEDDLSRIDYGLGPAFFAARVDKADDFCDALHGYDDERAKFIDLVQNPERFTGYDGPLAHRIWDSLYVENCFHNNFFAGATSPASQSVLQSFHASTSDPPEACIEQRVFYKLLSGLHSSISMHICDTWLDEQTGSWIRNASCFARRFAAHPDRLDNLYFLYSVLTRALLKLVPSLTSPQRWAKYEDGAAIARSFAQVRALFHAEQPVNPPFEEAVLFASVDGLALKAQFKAKFRNVSRIMDCVTCTKCRLWGKIQTQGLGTALKILYSLPEDAGSMRLTKSELSSFINVFGRTSHSVGALKRFRASNASEEPSPWSPSSEEAPIPTPGPPRAQVDRAPSSGAPEGEGLGARGSEGEDADADEETDSLLRAVDLVIDWILQHQLLSYAAFTLFILLWMR